MNVLEIEIKRKLINSRVFSCLFIFLYTQWKLKNISVLKIFWTNMDIAIEILSFRRYVA